MSVIIKDRGWDGMINRVSRDAVTKVGYPTDVDSIYDDGIEVVQVAAVHEFGANDIPMRPHVRPAYDENIESISKFAARELGKVIDGTQTVNQGIARLGEYHAGQIKRKIKTGPFKPLSPVTIAHKGSDKPLIDTGQMIQSIDHVEEVT